MLMLVKMGGETGEVESGQHVPLHLAATSCDYMLQKLSSQLELWTSSHVDNPHSAVKKEERAESIYIYIHMHTYVCVYIYTYIHMRSICVWIYIYIIFIK